MHHLPPSPPSPPFPHHWEQLLGPPFPSFPPFPHHREQLLDGSGQGSPLFLPIHKLHGIDLLNAPAIIILIILIHYFHYYDEDCDDYPHSQSARH